MGALKQFGLEFTKDSPINILFQEIDFQSLKQTKGSGKYEFASFHGIRIRYKKEYPTYFSIKGLSTEFMYHFHECVLM